MSGLTVEEVKAMLEAATPGPWRAATPMFRCQRHQAGGHSADCQATFDGWWEGTEWHPPTHIYCDPGFTPETAFPGHAEVNELLIVGTWNYDEGGVRLPADVHLIAAAPDLAAAFLALSSQLAAAEARERELRAALEEIRHRALVGTGATKDRTPKFQCKAIEEAARAALAKKEGQG